MLGTERVDQRAAGDEDADDRRRSRRWSRRASSPASGARWRRRRCRSRCPGPAGTTSAGRCPRFCRSRISASSTCPSLATALRRASTAGVRGTSPTNARVEAHASPRRPVNRPTTSSATVSSASSSERSGSRRPPVSVATERIRWRARSRSWWRSGPADLELLAVADPGLRGDDDAGAAEVDPPAQVDVVAVERDRRVEAAEGAEQVGPHEQARRREDEDVADGVVLLLVVLARLGDRVDLAEAVEAEADVLQHARLRPTSRAWDRRRRRWTGTAPRRARGSRRARGRRRRGRSRRTRCRPRRGAAPRWRRRRSRGWRRGPGRRRRAAGAKIRSCRSSPSASIAPPVSRKSVLRLG